MTVYKNNGFINIDSRICEYLNNKHRHSVEKFTITYNDRKIKRRVTNKCLLSNYVAKLRYLKLVLIKASFTPGKYYTYI